jgi:steroid delta-isomerase-like uncharacterized protein
METRVTHDTEQPLAAQADLERFACGLVHAWNTRDLDQFVGHFSPTYVGVDVNDPSPQHGHAGVRHRATRYLEAFPDLRLSCDAILADRGRVTVLWTARGTHRGSYLHIPPTHRPIEVRGVAVFTVADGLIRHGLYVWDTAGVLRALGLLPQL